METQGIDWVVEQIVGHWFILLFNGGVLVMIRQWFTKEIREAREENREDGEKTREVLGRLLSSTEVDGSKEDDLEAKAAKLAERIDRIEWDWNRFKRAPEAKAITEAIERLEREDHQKKQQQRGTKG